MYIGRRARLCLRVFQPLGGRAAPLAKLQVLLRAEGVHNGAGGTHREAQRAAALAHHQRSADVGGIDLRVPPGGLSAHLQTVMAAPLTAGDGAIDKGWGHVVQLSVVDLLLDALTPILKDDSYLKIGLKKDGNGKQYLKCTSVSA